MTSATPRMLPAVTGVGVVVVAVAVVAAGAATGLGDRDPIGGQDSVWLSLAVAGAAVTATGAGWMRWWAGRADGVATRRRLDHRALRLALVLLVLQVLIGGAVLAVLALTAGDDAGPDRSAPVPVERQPVPPPARATDGGVDLPLAAGAVLTVLGLVGAGAAVMVLRSRRPAEEPEPLDESVADAIAASVADLDALADDPDHRRAVIRAYARMERALARSGSPRRPSEAPFEYLARALGEVGVGSGSAHRLTALFERARFSPAPVDVGMRSTAAALLRAVQDDLGVAA